MANDEVRTDEGNHPHTTDPSMAAALEEAAKYVEKIPEFGMKTTDKTLIEALRILARDIQSDDGVANACILEAVLRLEELTKWQPIETAPKDGRILIFLAKSKYAKFDLVLVGHWYKTKNKWVYDTYVGEEPDQPTYWMPLPPPPEIEKVKA